MANVEAETLGVKSGVIEGFFGKPWNWPARLAAVDFLREFGYEFYVYAPKADSFLRRRWREPLPDETLQRLLELSICGVERGVSIGVGLTPFGIYSNYDTAARTALRAKVRQLNETGIDLLCILFDDMRGDVSGLPNLQAAIVADVCGWSSARRFIVCPTYYSYDSRLAQEFGPPPQDYLSDFGRIIDSRVDIFWTGEKVISVGYSVEHLSDVTAYLRRKPFLWDNSISNDSKIRTNHLYLDPSASGWTLPVNLVAGLAINPLTQPYLARIALCRFQQLLIGNSQVESKSSMNAVQRLGGQEFAMQIEEDAALLQQTGLARLDDDTRRRLLSRYGAAPGNP